MDGCTHGSSVEILGSSKYQCLSLWDTLHFVCPLPRNLDSGLDSLCSGVHWQNHVISKHLLDLLCPLGEDIVVEGARGEGEARSLLGQCLDQLGVAMALIDSTICGETVDVMLSFRVPNARTLCPSKDNWERMIVVCGVLVLGFDGARGRGGMVFGLCQYADRLECRSRGFEGAAIGIGGVCVRSHGEWFFVELDP